jgi:hypothetical protein
MPQLQAELNLPQLINPKQIFDALAALLMWL